MVFTRLSSQEKDAFFGLLDEYFQSRPDIFAQTGDRGEEAASAAASAVHRTLAKNPEFTSKIVSAGVTHGLAKSNNPYASTIASHPGVSNSVGRVAAASLSFTGGNSSSSSSNPPTRSLVVPSLPQRSSSALSASSSGSEIDKLVTTKSSLLGAFKKNTTTHGVAIPPAFSTPRTSFGPPPVRRTTSDTNAAEPSTARSPPPILPRRQVEPEPEEPQGEWADVLYDYTSEDPGDLEIQTGSRVLVTAKSSDDWWTGQIDGEGREGLFPASYVKLL